MAKFPPIRSIIAFEAAARLGSFKRAADELAITPSAVSHNVRALEAHLGVLLFERRARSVMLTDPGHRYAELIGRFADQLERATEIVAGYGGSEILTLHAPLSFSATWLPPRLTRFGARYPDIELRLRCGMETPNFVEDGVDIAIRFDAPPRTSVFTLPLFPEAIVPLVAPGYWAELPGDDAAQKLARARLIHSDRDLVGWTEWLDKAGLTHPSPARGPKVDRGHIAIELASSGCGIALESMVLAHEAIGRGDLIELFADRVALVPRRTYNVMTPLGLEGTHKIKVFLAFLAEEAKRSAIG